MGSDGLDVLGSPDTVGGWKETAPTPDWVRQSTEEEYTQVPREWKRAFREMNPRELLSRIESVLTAGAAGDNTTAIALRNRPTRDERYVPVSDVPEREPLGGDPT